MKVLKLIAPLLVVFTIATSSQKVYAQDLTKDQEKEIKAQEEEIDVNEEVLLTGVKGLDRIKSRFEKDKAKGKLSDEEIARKEGIILNVEKRLSGLDAKIKAQKEKLNAYKSSLNIAVEAPEEVQVSNTEVAKTSTSSNSVSDIKTREQELQAAREKLEREMKESEAAFLRKQQELKEKNEKLAAMQTNLKEEKAAAKIAREKQQKIAEYQDEIAINEEMLATGNDGLAKMKEKFEAAKTSGSLTLEATERRASLIKRLEDKLVKLEKEINDKKEAIKSIQ